MSEPMPESAAIAGVAGQPSGEDVAGQLDAIFGESPVSEPMTESAAIAGVAGQPSGEDVAGQLDAIFGESPMSEPMPESAAIAGVAGQPSGEDVAGQLDAIFGESPVSEPMPESAAIAGVAGQPSGEDVAGQLDAIFGGAGTGMPAAQPPALTEGLALTDDSVLAGENALSGGFDGFDAAGAGDDGQFTGDDLAGHIDALFGEPAQSVSVEPPGAVPTEASALQGAGDGHPSGDDVAGQLDALFGGEAARAASAAVLAGKSALMDKPAPTDETVPTGEPASTVGYMPIDRPVQLDIPAPPVGGAVSSGNAVTDQLDELFGGQAVLSAGDIPAFSSADFTPAAPGGEASADQLDELFGGQAVLSADDIPESASADFVPAAPGGEASADQLDELFGGQAVLSADDIPESALAGLTPMATGGGSAVDQFDELCDGITILPPETAPEGDASAGFGPDVPSGNAVVDQLDALFGAQTVLPPAAMPEFGAAGTESAAVTEDAVTYEDVAAMAAARAAAGDGISWEPGPRPFPETADALSEVSGDDVENRIDALFGGAGEPKAAAPAAPADELGEAAITAALEEAASMPATESIPAEPALIADESGEAPEGGAGAAAADAMTAAAPPAAIVLDENGEDIAKPPSADDIEDRLDAMFGESGPSATKEPLIVDENAPVAAPPAAEAAEISGTDMTGNDVEERLEEIFGTSDTTTAIPVEEIMGCDIDSVLDTDTGEAPADDLAGVPPESSYDTPAAVPAAYGSAVDGVETGSVAESDMEAVPANAIDAAAYAYGSTVDGVETGSVVESDMDAVPANAIDAAAYAYGSAVDGVETGSVAESDMDAIPANAIDADGIVVIDMNELVGIDAAYTAEVAPDAGVVIDTAADAVIYTDNVVDTLDAGNIIDIDNANAAVSDDVVVIDMNELAGIDADAAPAVPDGAAGTGDIDDMDEAAILAALEAEAAKPQTDIPMDVDVSGIIEEYNAASALEATHAVDTGNTVNTNTVEIDDLSDDPFTCIPGVHGVDSLSDDPFTSVPPADDLSDDPFLRVPGADAAVAAGILNGIDDIDGIDSAGSGDSIVGIGSVGGIAGAPELPSVDEIEERLQRLFMEEKSVEAGSEADTGIYSDSGMDSGTDSDIGTPVAAAGAARSGHDSIFAGPDERDTPFDLPDHVLTSTLADIYYQQGQPQLALHIYERLVLRDPGDARLVAKVEEIRGVLQQLGEGGTLAPVEAARPEKAPSAPSGRKKKAPPATARADTRPLAGVRIKKSATPAKKGKRPAKPKS
jgi:hypothetical protein